MNVISLYSSSEKWYFVLSSKPSKYKWLVHQRWNNVKIMLKNSWINVDFIQIEKWLIHQRRNNVEIIEVTLILLFQHPSTLFQHCFTWVHCFNVHQCCFSDVLTSSFYLGIEFEKIDVDLMRNIEAFDVDSLSTFSSLNHLNLHFYTTSSTLSGGDNCRSVYIIVHDFVQPLDIWFNI